MTEVTVVGAGVMGSALTRALLAAGHSVTVWNRTAERAEPLRAAGASVAPTLLDAVRASEATLICVADQAAARALLAEPEVAATLSGRLLVQMTTGTPADGRLNAVHASEQGIAFLDAAIMAYPRTVGSDAAVFLYAGTADTFQRLRGVLAHLGQARYVGEDAGRAAALDAALIGFFYGSLAGFLHGAALTVAESSGIEEYLELAMPFMASFITDAVRETGERIVTRDYSDAQSSMRTHLGGIDLLVVGSSRAAGIDVSVMDAIRATFASAVAAGHGNDDIAVLLEAGQT